MPVSGSGYQIFLDQPDLVSAFKFLDPDPVSVPESWCLDPDLEVNRDPKPLISVFFYTFPGVESPKF